MKLIAEENTGRMLNIFQVTGSCHQWRGKAGKILHTTAKYNMINMVNMISLKFFKKWILFRRNMNKRVRALEL